MSTTSDPINATTSAIAPATVPGAVSLTVSDLSRAGIFYETALGLRPREREDGALGFGAPDGPDLVVLHGDASAPPLRRRAPGLYHVAILFPSRRDLAQALARLVRAQWPLDGASDHLVSEALYLSDPEGNGIELYHDRPRSEWSYDGGQLRMATLALDLQNLYDQVAGSDIDVTVARGTVVGHVHLQVTDIPAAEAFYAGILGFDVTVRGYPGALFVSAGGYHHHLGLNTWHSAGASPAPAGSVGLRSYELLLPDEAELERVLVHIGAAGLSPTPVDGPGAAVQDPAGNLIVLRSR